MPLLLLPSSNLAGSLTMIVGGVGSGKSSVLNALIGHITRKGGEVEVGGRIAYVAQSAWIMNDTLQVGMHKSLLCIAAAWQAVLGLT